ncbi:MAG: 4-(cytidine 5'-diphospho)-2-C-methyl-D-erythritol kinase [Candidatus Micrarchaeota archaeon]
MLAKKAFAKTNLFLDVIRKRGDGYHDVLTVFQQLALADDVQLNKTETPGELYLSCSDPELDCGDKNLVSKAVKLIRENTGNDTGLRIDIRKRIPLAGGLAGGSADAGATLTGLNELLGLRLSQDQLVKLAVKLGADVAFCVIGGTCVGEGIGEKLARIKSPSSKPVVVVDPQLKMPEKKTLWAYQNLPLSSLPHPSVEPMKNALRQNDWTSVCASFYNCFEEVTPKHYPVVNEIKDALLAAGATGALMNGSGPTVFGVFDSPRAAERGQSALSESFSTARVVLTATL